NKAFRRGVGPVSATAASGCLQTPSQSRPFFRLLRYAMRYWPSYLARASLVLIDIVSDLAFAWFTMQLIDSAVAGDVAGVRFALGVGVALLLIGAVNNYLAQHLGVLTTDRVRRDLRRDLFDHIMRLPTRFFAKTH